MSLVGHLLTQMQWPQMVLQTLRAGTFQNRTQNGKLEISNEV